MNKLLSIFILCFLALSGSVIAQTFNAASTPFNIPDGNLQGVTTTVSVSGLGGTVATANEIQVNLNISHSWSGDIFLAITPPGGSEIVLINRLGVASTGCSANTDFVGGSIISIRQNATTNLPNTNVPSTIPAGIYLPTGCATGAYPVGSLASCVGAARDGNWTIRIADVDAIMTGSLNSASITFFDVAPVCTNPTAYNVTGGGAYCAGGTGVAVGLANSETGVNYQLKLNGSNDGAAVAGTGSAISFGTKTAVGNYTVVATSAVGSCTANMTGSVDITVNPTPPAPSITANTYMPCGGTQFTLTAVPATGYTGAEYLWLKNGTPVASQTGGPGTYTVNAGTVAASNDYTLQMVYSGSTCLSAASATATVVTNVPNAVITPSGATTFCVGTPTTLNASTGTGYTYQWRRGSTIVQVGGTSYIPTASGNHTVIVKDAYNCSKTSAVTSITINALPTANAGADVNLCKGSSVVIGAASISGNTYTWSPTTGLSDPYISNPTLATNASGTYTVSVTDGLKGCSKSDAMVVTSISGPATPSVSKTVSGSTITLTSTTPGAASVNWYSNGTLLFSNMAPNSSINVVASNPTKAYTVKSKGTNGCFSSFSNFVSAKIGDGKTGDVVVEIEEGIMQAYPNPTNGLLNVVINDAALTGGTLLLYNGLGQVVATKEVSFFGGKANTTLDLQHLAAGVYSLSFENKVVKVVKE